MSIKTAKAISLTDMHRMTGQVIGAAALGTPTVIMKYGVPFVLILPARDLNHAAELAATIAEEYHQEGEHHEK